MSYWHPFSLSVGLNESGRVGGVEQMVAKAWFSGTGPFEGGRHQIQDRGRPKKSSWGTFLIPSKHYSLMSIRIPFSHISLLSFVKSINELDVLRAQLPVKYAFILDDSLLLIALRYDYDPFLKTPS